MFIVDCLPFKKGLNKESLSYFSTEYLEPGSLIKINIRSKSAPALILESRNALEIKAEIRSADFQMKKVSSIVSKPFLQKEFLEAIQKTSEYFISPQGGILSHLIPSFILENPNLLSVFKKKLKEKNSPIPQTNKKVKNETAILQTEDDERFIHYKSFIREEFAKGKSVFLCLPQNEDIKRAKEKLEKGIESFVCVFHKDLNKKDLKKEWQKACLTEHPVLIIGTARWLFIPRNDFGAIIIDKENESGWQTLSRPFIDLRFFAEMLANQKHIRAVIGDSFLRTETLYRYKQGDVSEFESVKWRLPTEIKTEVIDLRKSVKKEFRTLSPELLKLIDSTVQNGSNMFIFAARKGLSSVTVCRDCGEQVKCFNCSAPMILYKTKTGNAFKCHQCGEARDAAEVCQNCRSWKLAAFGSGIDRIAEEIKKSFSNVNLFEIHGDTVATSAKALNITKSFYENGGSVLLGTEMALPYLNKKIANAAIASFDSLFSVPDFRIREKIFRIILQVRNLAEENFLIQSRNPKDPALECAVSGNLMDFFKKETDDRRVLGYPPFGIFIKITARGSKNFVVKETESLKKIFSQQAIIFNSIHEKMGEQAAVNAVIRLSKENSRNKSQNELFSLVKSLPAHFEIKVDPDNLL